MRFATSEYVAEHDGPDRDPQAPRGQDTGVQRDLSSPDGALKTIVAFANTAGGTLLIGVEDRKIVAPTQKSRESMCQVTVG